MKKIILLIAICVFSAGVACAVERPPAEDLMKTGAGARPMGMGKAFVAVADDGSAPFLNPAGLAALDNWQMTSMYVGMFEGDLPYTLFTFSRPLANGNIGAGIISTGTSDIISPSSQGLTYFDYYDRVIFMTCAFGKKQFSWGGNAKIFSRGFTGERSKAEGFDIDLGFKYRHTDRLAFGANIQNAFPTTINWSSGAEDDVPVLLKLGSAARLPKNNVLLALDLDLPMGRPLPTVFHFGAEWPLSRILTLRAGLDQSISAHSHVSTNPTAGVGIKFRGFRLDYAYHPYQDIFTDVAHFFSLSYSPEVEVEKP